MPRVLLVLLLVATTWAGCVPVTTQVERAIERELPRVIGPADRYEVRVEGIRARTAEAERVTVLGERVRPEGAPVLDRLDLELLGVRYDLRRERLERVDSTHARARLTPADLVAFMEEHRNVQQASLTLHQPDRATIRIRPALAGFDLPRGLSVDVHGQLTVEDDLVAFRVIEVRAVGTVLGERAARQLSDLINPLVDLSDIPMDLQVTSIHIAGGAIWIEATGDPTTFHAP
jgi:hypothetical protein